MAAADPRARSPYILEEVTVSLHRSKLGAGWRWRSEVLAALVLVAVVLGLWALLHAWLWALAVTASTAAIVMALPWSRRFLLARAWAVHDRHRLQRAFWECRIHTRAGLLPLIPWVTATPVGTRAVVLARAGMELADFEDSAGKFAAACGARDCRVTGSGRWKSVVFIDIIRRDVLGPARIVASPLTGIPGPGPAWPLPARTEGQP